MEFFVQPNGSLFKLTKGEFDFIMDAIREENPLRQPAAVIRKYTREDFLSSVYMTRERYDVLEALLRNKMNVILQGAPGVGKTFTAKKLAWAMMGEMDEFRIEMVQFHQNYANVKHFFTLLGKMFFTSYGKEFFSYSGKQIFTS